MLTEKDVEQMESHIGEDTSGEREFLEEQLPGMQTDLKRLRALWRLQKAIRDDAGIKKTFDDFCKLENSIQYANTRLFELSGK